MRTPFLLAALCLPIAGASTTAFAPAFDAARVHGAAPTIDANDNRNAAGQRSGGIVTVRLQAALGTWYPEKDEGPGHAVYAFGEEGRPLKNPGPLLRAEAGTSFHVTLRNATPDAMTVHGLHDRPGAAVPLTVAPGETREVRFTIGAPGTYLYWATTTGSPILDRTAVESQLSGALVIDAPGAPVDDRIFVIGIEAGSGPVPRLRPLHAVVVNGRSWPHTTRLTATTGDTVRMRWINASERPHPIHLHGFYFRVDSRGSGAADTIFAPALRPMVATQFMAVGQSIALQWVPERAGNWLMHCHMLQHISPDLRLGRAKAAHPKGAHANHTLDVMSGLVIGIEVKARPGERVASDTRTPRDLRLLVQTRPRVYGEHAGIGFTVARDSRAPAADSIEIPGPPLVLTRGEPVRITVVNRLAEPTSVHWHGIELDSYFDGVSGYSGAPGKLAPAIAPGDSFVVRFTPPRAGTFIYHTHFEEHRQLTSGLYGPIIVVEPGAAFDPEVDRIWLIGSAGPDEPPPLLLNGTRTPELDFEAGKTYRIRVINMHANAPLAVRLFGEGAAVRWRAVAKDGMTLPAAQATMRPAEFRLGVGEVYDFEWTPEAPRALRFEAFILDRALILEAPVRVR